MSKQAILQLGRGANGYNIADNCYRVSLKTGVIGADQAANSCFFSLRPGFQEGVGAYRGISCVTRIRIQYTTIAAFTTPITAGRSLAIRESQSGNPTNGTRLDIPFFKGYGRPDTSLLQYLNGGAYISTTVPLDVTPRANIGNLLELSLTGLGAAGSSVDRIWDFGCDGSDPIVLSGNSGPFQAGCAQLVLFNPVLMDPGGTFEVLVEADLCELPNNFAFPT